MKGHTGLAECLRIKEFVLKSIILKYFLFYVFHNFAIYVIINLNLLYAEKISQIYSIGHYGLRPNMFKDYS